MANTFPPRVGTVFAERYQLRESLGSGGVGQVFRAWDVQAQRLVALKAFNPAGVSPTTWAAYFAVVEAAAPVRHPDLVLPQGLPPALPPAPFGVMESLVGENLATMRARMGRVPWQRAVEIGARCAEILHAVIGATGIGHRDLKASNVFVTESGAVKLLDYGVAEFDVQSPDRTRVDSMLGVVDYKAPEQLEANIGSVHADVFSLAVLVFEMIAGERPFAGASYFIVARKILLEPAPLLSEVAPAAGGPPALDALLQRALAKRPGDRFEDLQAMQKALQDALRGTPRAARGPGRPATAATPPPQPARPASKPAAPPEVDEDDMTMLAAPRTGGRKPGIRPPTGQVKQVVPSGAKAVVMAGAGESIAGVSKILWTVVGGVGSSPLAERDAALHTISDQAVVSAPSTRSRPRASVHPPEPAPEFAGRDAGPSPQPERTMIFGDANAPPRGEATLMLPGDAPAPESTMMLPDDGPRPESTMMLPDDGVQHADGRTESPEGTMQIAGEAPTTSDRWPLQKILIMINVACGLLILIGLLVLVLGGGAEVLEK